MSKKETKSGSTSEMEVFQPGKIQKVTIGQEMVNTEL